ncbi:MAG: hypothetical protein WD119_01090 [Pirellulaceae bacterium]
MQNLQPGDWVVYRKSKQSRVPGPRAQRITASQKGDNYGYIVDKFWVVDSVFEDGTVSVRTRRGKVHRLAAEDRCLRKATFFERLLHRHRFRDIDRDASSKDAIAT